MSRKKKIEIEAEPGGNGESLEEESSGGTVAPSPELEEALREASAAVEKGAQGEASAAAGSEEDGDAAAPPVPETETPGEDVALELKQSQDRLLRLQADFENFRRRALREHTEVNQYGHQNLVKDLLPTVDNLDRAIDHARTSEDGDLENLLQGVELVRRELLAALAKHGVVLIEAVGKVFDPAHHEAMAQAPDASVAPNTVIEELQKGYLLRGRLLRPSRVVVARAPDEEDGAETREEGGATD
jgi:molecular chaperone GrpE